MTKNFEIKIPNYLLKENWQSNKSDYAFSLLVSYWYSGDGLAMAVQHLFDVGECIDWSNPRLKQYLTAACENNSANTGEEKTDLLDEESPTLHRQ